MKQYTITYSDNTKEVDVIIKAENMDDAVQVACNWIKWPEEIGETEIKATVRGDGRVDLTHADLIG